MRISIYSKCNAFKKYLLSMPNTMCQSFTNNHLYDIMDVVKYLP